MELGDKSPSDRNIRHPSPGLAKMSGVENLASTEELNQGVEETKKTSITSSDALKDAEYSYATEVPGSSELQTIEVAIELVKQPGRTLGFSIAGGRGSTPAYEDVDESIFVTKIASGGLAEQDGRLRLGDKLLKVNDVNMVNATHTEAVSVLKNMKEVCRLVVSREVLVVMPDEPAEEGDSRAVTPTPVDQDNLPAVQLTNTEDAAEEGQSFAKRIVAEILDRSVTRYRNSCKEGEEGAGGTEEAGGQKNNYINYDIAQTVLGSSKDVIADWYSEEKKDEDREGSRTPTVAEDESPHHDVVPSKQDIEVIPISPVPPVIHVETSFDEDDYPTEKVILDRSVGKLGLSIIGGSEHASRVFGGGRPGVYVSKISAGGAAEACDQLRLGDRILAVNGQNVRHSTHQQVVQWLVSQKGNIELLVEHVPQPAGLQSIVIKKSASAKLGVSIKGGTKSAKGNPLDPSDNGIFISKMTAGAAAEKDGRLQIGQRILEVNGTSLLGATHLVAVRALRNNPMEVSLLVCDGYDPREVVRRKEEQERLSTSYISATLDRSSLSSEASRSLDDAVRILSESMDALPTVPQATKLNSKLSQSSAAIVDQKPVTAEDLDNVLEGLAKFNVESSMKSTPDNMTSSPLPPLMPLSLSSDFASDLTAELFPLHSGEQLPLGLLGDDNDTPKLSRSEKENGVADMNAEAEEDEFSQVHVEDSSSYLEQLDSEVSHLQDEVLEEEGRLEEEVDNTKPSHRRRISSQRSMPRIPVAEPSILLTPETKRRIIKEMENDVDPTKDSSEKKEAMDSLIGEVFDDVSFNEFEETNTSEEEAAPAVEGVTLVAETQHTQDTAVVKLEAAPPVSSVSFKASKDEGKSHTLAPTSNTVLLRAESGNKDPSKRKSAPPRVAEKPAQLDPEKLSFKEKLALHKKNLEEQSSASSPAKPPLLPSSAREGYRRPTTPELGVSRPSEQATSSASSQANDIPEPQLSTAQLSAEERRLERILSRPAKYQVSSAQQLPAEKEKEPTQSKQNGEKPTGHSVKTTTIHIPSNPNHVSSPDTIPPNTNNNNSRIADEASKRGLPTSVVNFLSNMPEPVQAPADSEIVHSEQEAVDWERRKAWRDQKENELKQEVSRVQDLLSEVTADVQAKPSSDTTKIRNR